MQIWYCTVHLNLSLIRIKKKILAGGPYAYGWSELGHAIQNFHAGL
jgi:hypothetical protein